MFEDGKHEVMLRSAAQSLASKQGMDLIMVADKAQPPVMKLGEVDSLQRAQRRAEKEQRKREAEQRRRMSVKEVCLTLVLICICICILLFHGLGIPAGTAHAADLEQAAGLGLSTACARGSACSEACLTHAVACVGANRRADCRAQPRPEAEAGARLPRERLQGEAGRALWPLAAPEWGGQAALRHC